MILKMIRQQDQAVILTHGVLAVNYFTRLKGLMGRKQLLSGEGMLFPRCNSIHMWMMRTSIDVVFLKAKVPLKVWEIVEVRTRVRPWTWLPLFCARADDVLEVPSGLAERLQLKAGEVLCIAS